MMLMKSTTTSTLWLATVAVAAGSFCFLTTVRAQNENQRTDTEIADNPHLRKKSPTSSSSSKLSQKDQKFLTNAATSGFQEVADGQEAAQRASSAEVKNVGARMVADHSKANKELIALAKKKNLSVDTRAANPRPFKKEGFDSQYLFNMQHDHEMDIKAFENEASSGDDADIKAWAAKTLPTLKEHLAMVKSALKKLK
jgi:putative membrane protein